MPSGCERAGISNFGGNVTMGGVQLEYNTIHLHGDPAPVGWEHGHPIRQRPPEDHRCRKP